MWNLDQRVKRLLRNMPVWLESNHNYLDNYAPMNIRNQPNQLMKIWEELLQFPFFRINVQLVNLVKSASKLWHANINQYFRLDLLLVVWLQGLWIYLRIVLHSLSITFGYLSDYLKPLSISSKNIYFICVLTHMTEYPKVSPNHKAEYKPYHRFKPLE